MTDALFDAYRAMRRIFHDGAIANRLARLAVAYWDREEARG